MLASELRKTRTSVGMTQEELAAKAGVSREYVNYLERGKRQPTVAVFIRLCKAMKVHAPDVLERAMRTEK